MGGLSGSAEIRTAACERVIGFVDAETRAHRLPPQSIPQHGLTDELGRLGLLRQEGGTSAPGFTVEELEEFCSSFLGEIEPLRMPSDERLSSAAKSVLSAAREVSSLTPMLPPSMTLQSPGTEGSLSPTTLVALMRDAERQLRVSRRHLTHARTRLNPTERLFRARWELFATERTCDPLESIGTILFNATFGANIDEASYARMVRRDRRTLRVPKRRRTAEPQKSR